MASLRGRLIFVFLAELHRLDTKSIALEDPDSEGPLTGGYDRDFKEPVLVDLDDDGVSERIRREYPPIKVPCQVEPNTFEALSMHASGNVPDSEISLVFHFNDLERLDLVNVDTGDALIRPGDRLGAIYDKQGKLIQRIRNPPGLYVKEARPIGFGLNMSNPRRNLLLVTFTDRRQAARS